MTIFNLGSINIDHTYHLDYFVEKGETLVASDYQIALGGKGANQSVAIAKAKGQVFHIGAIGQADKKFLKLLASCGVNTSYVQELDSPSGHAIVMVEKQTGQNQIIIYSAANRKIKKEQLENALQKANPQDWVLAQNETSLVADFFEMAKQKNLKICYSAAPFIPQQTAKLLPLTDLLVVNEIEITALCEYLDCKIIDLKIPHLIITKSDKGISYFGEQGNFDLSARKVKVVNSTGAGDTFLGYLLARISQGWSIKQASEQAIIAASLQISKQGTINAIPSLEEVEKVEKVEKQ